MNILRVNNKSIIDSLISMVIISSYLMIFLSFFLDIQQTTYFLFAAIFFSILSFIIVIRNGADKIMQKGLLFAVVTLAHCLIFMGTIKLVDSLIAISVVCFAAVVYKVQLSPKNRKILIFGATVCAVLLLINQNDSRYMDLNGWLQYVYKNPNTAGGLALNLFAVMLIGSLILKNKFLRYALWLVAFFMLKVIMNTHSRAAFISAIILVILLILQKVKPIKPKIGKILILLPVISIPIVIILFDVIFPQDAMLLDKSLFSGREYMWLETISVVLSNFFNFENEFTSGLNLTFKLVYLCGLFGTVIFFNFFLYIEKDSRLTYANNRQNNRHIINTAILVFSVLWICQSFESTMISGTYAITYISMSILGLANCWRET